MTFAEELSLASEVQALREQLAAMTIERDTLREQLHNAITDAIKLRGQVANLLYQGQQ